MTWKKSHTKMLEAQEALRTAVMAFQDTQLAILEEGQGALSADFKAVEGLEDSLVRAQYSLAVYRANLPHVHPWHEDNGFSCYCGTAFGRLKPGCEPCEYCVNGWKQALVKQEQTGPPATTEVIWDKVVGAPKK